ncbi:MAG: Stp1/IreP family PP2C-type Ser/Thr phosphatase [Desulfuromonadaceae bacterium]
MNIHSVGMTDKGARRSNNEDAFVILANERYCSVADGMGGAAAGEVASKIFVDTVLELFSDITSQSEQEVDSTIREAFLQGNERIILSAKANPSYEGMGCTAEVIAFFDERYTIGHVGDSRTYLFRGGELSQITKDHSYVQHQVDQGLISAEEARTHTMKNVVLRALGIDESLSLDIIRGRVLPGDIYLLCSDGLSDMLSDSTIVDVLETSFVLEQKVDMLIKGAIAAGGKDNVTVVLCQAD